MNKSQLLNKALEATQKFLEQPGKLPKILVILGATASGKTWLSIGMAKKLKGEIISADSRQVWRNFDIGTAKVTPEEMQKIPHHLIDVINADQEYTLWNWKTAAEKIISKLINENKLPIITGGTGLYVEALIENFQIPQRDPMLRIKLEKKWQKDQGRSLWQELNKMNPKTAQRFKPQSQFHLIRALEIMMLNQKKKKGIKKFEALKIGIRWPRKIQREKITKRVNEILKQGLVAEVKKLLKIYDPKNPAMTSIGYREIIAYLQGKISLSEAHDQIIKNTCQYAKRQDTWWRRHDDILWLEMK